MLGGDTATLKEDKVLSPASRRVKDAAESLLITLLEQVGQEPSPKQGQYETAHSQVVEDTEFYRYTNPLMQTMIFKTSFLFAHIKIFRHRQFDNTGHD